MKPFFTKSVVAMLFLMVCQSMGCNQLLGPQGSNKSGPKVQSIPRFIVRLAPDEVTKAVGALGLERTAFGVVIPKYTWCTIWVETYRDGKLLDDLTFGQSYISGKEETREFYFNRYSPNSTSETKSSKTRWSLNFDGDSQYHWVDDPREPSAGMSGPADVENWTAQEKEETTVYIIVSNKGTTSITPNNPSQMISKNALVVFVKVRFDPKKGDPPNEFGSEIRGFDGMPNFDNLN